MIPAHHLVPLAVESVELVEKALAMCRCARHEDDRIDFVVGVIFMAHHVVAPYFIPIWERRLLQRHGLPELLEVGLDVVRGLDLDVGHGLLQEQLDNKLVLVRRRSCFLSWHDD